MRKTCLDMVYELAKRDQRVIFIGSDLGPGVLDKMRTEISDGFFMEGVSEANIIGMAAGLALEGFIPYVNTIATFLTRRCFEQISMDLCLHDLPVRLIANGGGPVYAPLGPTHIAIDDMALMRSQPNMTVVAPSDSEEMKRFMNAGIDWPHPIYIRLGKGGDPVIRSGDNEFTIGKGIVCREPVDLLIAATGVMTNRALAAAELLATQGIAAGVVHFATVKPLDNELLESLARRVRLIVTLDEHLVSGGLGSAVLECINEANLERAPRIHRIGIPDQFTHQYGSQDSLMESFGLQPDQIAVAVAGLAKTTLAA